MVGVFVATVMAVNVGGTVGDIGGIVSVGVTVLVIVAVVVGAVVAVAGGVGFGGGKHPRSNHIMAITNTTRIIKALTKLFI